MGSTLSINKINFIDMQYAINNNLIIINTLSTDSQHCLIQSSLSPDQEIKKLNSLISTNKSVKIVIYGENSCDHNIVKKYNQLQKLGFKNLYVYIGGLFEWLLLQDIYGEEQFPTTTKIVDLLKYKGDALDNLRI
jgi:hypothetical protein|tara:strand:+ start:61 stop:465 length:405 start_codon:yes stop_codon:yes gene_type:complete